eukprot:594726-Amphidinium_carterae.1
MNSEIVKLVGNDCVLTNTRLISKRVQNNNQTCLSENMFALSHAPVQPAWPNRFSQERLYVRELQCQFKRHLSCSSPGGLSAIPAVACEVPTRSWMKEIVYVTSKL